MDKLIRDTLHGGERVEAHTVGRLELGKFGGTMFPSQGILVGTDERILYFEKTAYEQMEFLRELRYEDVVCFAVYPDIFHGLAGLMAKVLHLQPQNGEPIRMVGPVDYKAFARLVKTRQAAPAKGRVW